MRGRSEREGGREKGLEVAKKMRMEKKEEGNRDVDGELEKKRER